MRKFSVNWRLLGGFSALLFLITLMGFIGIYQIHSLSLAVDNLGKRYLPMQSATLEMRISNNLYAMGIRNYVFWKSSRYLEAARAATDLGEIEESEKEFDYNLALYFSYIQSNAPEYQQWIKKIKDSVKELRLTGSRIINLVDEGASSGSINKLLMSFESQLYKIDDFLDANLQEFNFRTIKNELELASLRAERAILFLKWSLFFGVLIGGYTAWFVYRNQKRERESREELARRMISLEEKERKNLSFQVHDEMGQDLSALKIYLDLADKKIPHDSTEAKNNIAESIKILKGLMKKSHNISELLRPPALDEIGLVDTISALIVQYRQMTGINFIYEKPDLPVSLVGEYSLLLYRVAQEGLTNIVNHAQAKNVGVLLKVKNNVAQLSIQDDGVGFDYKDFLKQPHFRKDNRVELGLLGLKEHVEFLNGFMHIKTAPGKGTRLTVELPAAKF